ncbi:MAG: hypothetical protein IKF14_05470 [Atopobiaceae bacterium]|nr:hypothetical protein [Atopobiaceae bacterium]
MKEGVTLEEAVVDEHEITGRYECNEPNSAANSQEQVEFAEEGSFPQWEGDNLLLSDVELSESEAEREDSDTTALGDELMEVDQENELASTEGEAIAEECAEDGGWSDDGAIVLGSEKSSVQDDLILTTQSCTRPAVTACDYRGVYDGRAHAPSVYSPDGIVYFSDGEPFGYDTSTMMLINKLRLGKVDSIGAATPPARTSVGTTSASYMVLSEPAGQLDIMSINKVRLGKIEASESRVVIGTVTVSISACPISWCDITLASSSLTYDGRPKTPSVAVRHNGNLLTNGVDYTLAYANNTNVGESTVTVTGRGNYTGTKQLAFRIAPQVSKPAIVLSRAQFTYNGKFQRPTITLKDGSKTLVQGTDYEQPVVETDAVNAKTYQILVRLRGEYAQYGSVTSSYRIASANMSNATVAMVSDHAYTGTQIKPEPEVKLGGVKLVKGRDYTFTYACNTQVGSATITISAKGGNLTGQKKVSFRIVRRSVSAATVSSIANKIYTGSAIKPAPTVKVAGRTLRLGTDYRLSYTNNTKVGTAKVTVTGINNYSGAKTASFKIVRKSISQAIVSGVKSSYPYTGKGITPVPTVKSGPTMLKNGTHYTLSYKNNKKCGTATIVLKGKGFYAGTKKITFKIVKKKLSKSYYALYGATLRDRAEVLEARYYGTYDPSLSYFLYDINGDDIKELVMIDRTFRGGVAQAYTIVKNGGKLVAKFVGALGGGLHWGFYKKSGKLFNVHTGPGGALVDCVSMSGIEVRKTRTAQLSARELGTGSVLGTVIREHSVVCNGHYDNDFAPLKKAGKVSL